MSNEKRLRAVSRLTELKQVRYLDRNDNVSANYWSTALLELCNDVLIYTTELDNRLSRLERMFNLGVIPDDKKEN